MIFMLKTLSYLLIFFLSLVDLQTYNVWLGTKLIGENLSLIEAKLLANKEHQKLVKQFLNPVTE